jgi:hypothetical protein
MKQETTSAVEILKNRYLTTPERKTAYQKEYDREMKRVEKREKS